MKVIEKVQDIQTLKEDYIEVYDYLEDLIESLQNDEPSITLFPGDYLSDYYGGNFFVIENYNELENVLTPIESELPKSQQHWSGWASILETPAGFDYCDWIKNKSYVAVLLCTNNAGGDTYFIPRAIATSCSNVLQSIELSNIE